MNSCAATNHRRHALREDFAVRKFHIHVDEWTTEDTPTVYTKINRYTFPQRKTPSGRKKYWYKIPNKSTIYFKLPTRDTAKLVELRFILHDMLPDLQDLNIRAEAAKRVLDAYKARAKPFKNTTSDHPNIENPDFRWSVKDTGVRSKEPSQKRSDRYHKYHQGRSEQTVDNDSALIICQGTVKYFVHGNTCAHRSQGQSAVVNNTSSLFHDPCLPVKGLLKKCPSAGFSRCR